MPENRSTTLEDFDGRVDEFSNGVASGWVRPRTSPNERPRVELLSGGNAVVSTLADRPDNNPSDTGTDQTAYTFALRFPRNIDLQPPFSVRVAGTDVELPIIDKKWPTETMLIKENRNPGFEILDADGNAFIVKLPAIPAGTEPWRVEVRHDATLIGSITMEPGTTASQEIAIHLGRHSAAKLGDMDVAAICGTETIRMQIPRNLAERPAAGIIINHGFDVSGWVPPHSDGTQRKLRLRRDGEIVWEGQAMRSSDRKSGSGETPCCEFRVRLPDPDPWKENAIVVLEDAQSGDRLAKPYRAEYRRRFHGFLDACRIADDMVTLSGWVQDKLRPFDPISIEFVQDDVIIGPFVANQYREDLIPHGIGVGQHGFMVKVPCPEMLRTDLPIQAIIAGTGLVFDDADVIESASTVTEGESTEEPAVGVSDPRLLNATAQGRVESVSSRFVSGWARYKEYPTTPVLLDLYLNGSYYQSTLPNSFRADVAKHFGDEGKYGYHFELSPSLAAAGDLKATVRPRYSRTPLTNDTVSLALQPDAVPLNGQGRRAPSKLATIGTAPSTIAYIVISLNAADMLEALFEGFERTNVTDNYELIVVDHGSTDGSIELCEEWSKKLRLKLLARGRNHSFSASNNFGVDHTEADVVVFLNNDVVPCQDMTPALLEPFADPDVGMVGMKLYDQRPPGSFERTPLQHLGVHFNDYHRNVYVAGFETRYAPHLEHIAEDYFEVPAVTGALMACRRDEFLSLGGFDEDYFYGQEDVDLCLRYTFSLGKKIVCNNRIGAYHVRGYSRAKAKDSAFGRRQKRNVERLQGRFGSLIRRTTAKDRFARPGFWSTRAPVIAFAVSEATMETAAGDYFTALDLAEQLRQVADFQIVFLDKEKNWFDLSGIDVLITMRDDYDLRNIQNAAPHLLKIGWARNWIDRWGQRPWVQTYDLLWASSQTASDHLSAALARDVEVVRIATAPERFRGGEFRDDLASDYCFTGSFFGAPREIIYNLDPRHVPYDFALFGHGWDKVPQLRDFCRGGLPYSEMPNVYASTRMVIDDANSATKAWGSVNSRVYDALAAGALVVTNGRTGAREVFGDLMPTYDSPHELEELLQLYLGDEELRQKTVRQLQEVIEGGNTYRHRALQIKDSLIRSGSQMRFSIKIGAPNEAVRDEWGDYHYALGLQRALTRQGHTVRIDCLDKWNCPEGMGDDVVIVLRGLSTYDIKPHQINLMWNISHPDMVSRAEYESYDHVFVASLPYARKLAAELEVPVTALLQCTDPEVFHDDHDAASATGGDMVDDASGDNLLFVGNSRDTFRQIVKDAVEIGLPLDVYGSRWEQFLPDDILKGTYVPNDQLSARYCQARAVLNDHWDDMRKQGFISNRLFDAAASGAFIITDPVEGLEEVFGDAIRAVRTKEDLADAAKLPDTDPERVAQMRRDARDRVRAGHSFDARATEILGVVEATLTQRLDGV